MVVKGVAAKLIERLFDARLAEEDPNYVAAFLLTFRTFTPPLELASVLLDEAQVRPCET